LVTPAADDIAKAIVEIVNACNQPDFNGWGKSHFSGVPPVSWYEFARAIVTDSDTRVLPTATKDYPKPARRPLNSVLDCSRIRRVFGIRQPDFRIPKHLGVENDGDLRYPLLASAGYIEGERAEQAHSRSDMNSRTERSTVAL